MVNKTPLYCAKCYNNVLNYDIPTVMVYDVSMVLRNHQNIMCPDRRQMISLDIIRKCPVSVWWWNVHLTLHPKCYIIKSEFIQLILLENNRQMDDKLIRNILIPFMFLTIEFGSLSTPLVLNSLEINQYLVPLISSLSVIFECSFILLIDINRTQSIVHM